MFVVVVTFKIKPDYVEKFLPLMLQNARSSLDNEEGCSQFDVCFDEAQRENILLYEAYTDRAAFDHHLASVHFLAFDKEVATMIETKQVQTFARMPL